MSRTIAPALVGLCLFVAGCVSQRTYPGRLVGDPRTELPQPNGGYDPAHQSGFQE